ncbi:MAG TPA: NAD(P)-dependent alcohol dehydrogenase [Thermoanaerobaculia bacterium]|nr:NAD(P)-dependent alcohol dehydrogenase [Thermoanaerobaculia bacterium]
MKAAVIDGYGGSDKLVVREVPDPGPPGPGQVLVRVRAASINPFDRMVRSGKVRFLMPARFPLILGHDAAGEVAAIGPEVTRFQPGDPVFGGVDVKRHGGSWAELALIPEGSLASKPVSLSFEEAAALPVAALTSLQALRDKGGLSAGEKVLINGAAGGVGHCAVQVARALGARVTAVASGRNQQFLRELGADETIDYQEEDFTGRDEQWHVILDAAATRQYADCEPVLARDGGVYVSTVPGPKLFVWIALTTLGGLFGQKKRARTILVKQRAEDLAVLARMADQGKLRPHLAEVYPLERIAAAHDHSESGHVRGKVVVRIAP